MADEAMQVVRRCTFGFTPPQYDEVSQLGPDAWIDRQLQPELLPDQQVQTALASFPTLQLTPSQRDEMQGQYRYALEWRHSLLLRAVKSERQLQEVLVHVWYDHLNTSAREDGVATAKADEDAIIRTHSLGRFSELLKAVAACPTMLIFLDSVNNKIPHPNENFARELLELHTIGRDAVSEQDVHDAARVFTGWGVMGNELHFYPGRHDSGPASVAGWSTAGHAGPEGVEDGRSLLDYLARQPSTAHRVAERLARRFVGDDPPEALVDQAATAYLANDTQIIPPLRAILASDAFRDGGTPKVQRPFELLAAGLRVTNAQVDWSPGSQSAVSLSQRLNELNHLPGEEISPVGFSDRSASWVGSDALLQRWELMGDLGHGAMAGAPVNLDTLVGTGAGTAGDLVDRLSNRLLGQRLSDAHRQALFTFLGRAAADPVQPKLLRERRGDLVSLVLASPEFGSR